MRKLLFISCCLILVLVTACKKETKLETQYIVRLSAEDANKKIRKSESFLLYLTTNECYSCNEYDKVLKELQKNEKFMIHYLLVDDEDEEMMRELKVTLGDYETLPMTYYIEEGKVKKENNKAGYMEKEAYIKWLKEIDIVK